MKNKRISFILCLAVCLTLPTACVIKVNDPISFSFEGTGNIQYENAERYTSGNGQASGIRHLDIEWSAGSVTVEPYEGSEVRFEENGSDSLQADDRLHYWVDGSTLHIRFRKAGQYQLKDMRFKQLLVQVPAHGNLDEVEVGSISADLKLLRLSCHEMDAESTSGEVEVNSVNCNECSIETVSGDIVLTNVSCRELSAESTSGEIRAEGKLAPDLSVETVSGDIKLSPGIETTRIETESTSGNTLIRLPKQSGFVLDAETTSGKVSCDFPVIIKGTQYQYGNGEIRMSAESISGDIHIAKQ